MSIYSTDVILVDLYLQLVLLYLGFKHGHFIAHIISRSTEQRNDGESLHTKDLEIKYSSLTKRKETVERK